MGQLSDKPPSFYVLEFRLIACEDGDTRCFPVNTAARRICQLAGLEWLGPLAVRSASLAGYVIQVTGDMPAPGVPMDLVAHVFAGKHS